MGEKSDPAVSPFLHFVLCHSFRTCRIDPYGFERRHDFESYKEMMNEYVAVLNRRSMRWSKLLQEKPHMEKNLTGTNTHIKKHTVLFWCWLSDVISQIFVLEVKRYVRKGVPNEHRARIWMAASGAQEQLEGNPGYYQSLLAMEHDAKLKETIHIGETMRPFHRRHFDMSQLEKQRCKSFLRLLQFQAC